MARFPHMDGATQFPGVSNVDVWKYQNTFDYTRWPANVKLKVLNVPWCGDYENTVKFADDTARDAWFDAQDGETFTLDTMVHVLPEQSVKLPIPAPVLTAYNYLMVEMPRYTSDGAPVEYADGAWKSRYYYFIDNVSQRAANTTECILRLDYWTTYINDMRFDYVMLSRGHAPVAATDVDTYLSDPIDNADLLLAPDVNYSQPRICASTSALTLNEGDSYAVFMTSATFWDDWGSPQAPKVPESAQTFSQSAPSAYPWAVDVKDFTVFLQVINQWMPHWEVAIECVFIVSKKLVTPVQTFDFGGVTCYQLTAYETSLDLIDLSKDDFAYPERAKKYAKLYTYPYAQLEITDENGNAQTVRIEDTTGKLTVNACASLVMPWLNIDTQLSGIGKQSQINLSFQLVDGRNRTFSGNWFDTVRRYDIPVYSITQSAYVVADYKTLYERNQAALAAQNALTSANAAAQTANTNAVASADTAQTNANNSASNITANNAVTVAANSSTTATKNSAASTGTGYSNANISAATAWDNDMCSAAYQAEQNGLAVAATNNNAQAGVSAVSSIVSGVASLATGNIGGALSSVGSLASTAVGWSAASASNAVSQSNSNLIYNATIAANNAKMTNNTSYSTAATDTQNDASTSITNTNNSASTSIANNNAGLIRTNAANTHSTQVGNANRTLSTSQANNQRTYDTAIAAIQAAWNQAGVNMPVENGRRANGEHAATRPMAMFAHVVTQPDSAIMQAASQFARFGYQLNQQWEISNLQVMKHFTYWECSEVWCTGSGNTVEVVQQAIKDIMARGVTVWSDPDEIGKVSVYDN